MAKFCSNCGKEIGDAQFCINCGTKVSNTSEPTGSASGSGVSMLGSGTSYLLTMIIPIICTILLLFNWITLELPYVDDIEVNCFNFLFKMFSVSKEIDGLGFVVFISLVVFVLACVVAGYTIRAVKAALEKNDYAPTYCGVVCKVSVALSVIMIVMMIIFKSLLESEMGTLGSLAGELFNLTAVPYIILVISILGIFIAKAADKELDDAYDMRTSGENAMFKIISEENMLKDGGWKCENCYKINPKYTGTCSCGKSRY